jgi:DNA (cytosine-5)-methyltransferase 1/site-specific DNA-methyltransferase (adenine-specific)
LIKLINDDCLNYLPIIENNSVDLFLLDPPYNASNSKLSFKDKHYTTVNEDRDKNFIIDFFDTCINKLKDGGQMLIFCSHHILNLYLQKNNIKLQQILHWCKKNPVPSFTKCYGFSIEYILWFVKQGKPYTFNKEFRFNYKDIFYTNINGWKQTKHPTEKPYNVIKSLVQTHSNENDLIVDIFMGSGTTGIACKEVNRNFIGVEKEKNYFDIAEKRINNFGGKFFNEK